MLLLQFIQASVIVRGFVSLVSLIKQGEGQRDDTMIAVVGTYLGTLLSSAVCTGVDVPRYLPA